MTEPIVPEPARRPPIGLWVAVAATVAAGVFLFWQYGADDDGDGITVPPLTVISPASTPLDRAETGPPKGVSVVTSSTTSSTLPITTTTTTPPIQTTTSAPLSTTTSTTEP